MKAFCKYNELDLPERTIFDDGKRIYYTYAADGRKLRVRYAQLNSHVGPITPIEDPFPMGGGTAGLNGGGMGDPGGGLEPVLDETVLLTRDYCGGHVWRNDTLERVNTDYGYFDGTGTYHAYVKDHQGNVRAVVAGGEAVERDDYYPYGMPIAGACQPSAEGIQPLKYTSKELDRFNRLDLYDFGARPYDPTRCAFLTGDPLAEDDPATGPTAFCAANPVRFTDPTGMIVYLYGEEAQTALSQLQERYDKYLTLSINNNALSYTIKKDEKGKNVKLNGEVKRLTNIIDDKSIEVLMAAKNTMTTSKGLEHLGGAFMGNSYSPDLIMAFQEVNPIVLSGIDCGDVGSSLMHELTEAYEGALIARRNKKSTQYASVFENNSLMSEDDMRVYNEAHRNATPQKIITDNYYDAAGRLVDKNDPKMLYHLIFNQRGEVIRYDSKFSKIRVRKP